MGQWGTGKVRKICRQCKNEFLARRDRLGIYCSRSCGGKSIVQKNYRVEKICIVCTNSYIVKRHRIETALYCSNECRRKNMPKKENHHKWNGGFSRTWDSKLVIKRLIKEKGECDMCKSKSKLQGHHIVPYSLNKELQSIESNIQVLCIYCHAKQHPNLANFILKGEVHG